MHEKPIYQEYQEQIDQITRETLERMGISDCREVCVVNRTTDLLVRAGTADTAMIYEVKITVPNSEPISFNVPITNELDTDREVRLKTYIEDQLRELREHGKL